MLQKLIAAGELKEVECDWYRNDAMHAASVAVDVGRDAICDAER